MGRLYVFLATLLQGVLIVAGTLAFILLHPAFTDYVAQKALRDNGIGYKKIEGSLLTGITVEGIAYGRFFRARKVSIDYRIWRLLSPVPTIDGVLIVDPVINPNRLPKRQAKSGDTNTTMPWLPPIVLERVDIERVKVRLPQTVEGTIHARKIRYYEEDVTIPKIELEVTSPYAGGRMEGSYEKRILTLDGKAWPSRRYRALAEKSLAAVPESLPIALKLDSNGVEVKTRLPSPIRSREGNATLSRLHLAARYHFGPGYMDAGACYRIESPALEADINETFLLADTLAYATKLEARVRKTTLPLPSMRFDGVVSGDREVMAADVWLKPFHLKAFTTDYGRFALHIASSPHRLDYIRGLPELFRHQSISLEGNATATLTPTPRLEGLVVVDGNFSRSKSYVEVAERSLLVRSEVVPKELDKGIWAVLPDIFKSDIHTYIYDAPDNKVLDVATRDAYLTLFEEGQKIEGWANIGSLSLDAKGRASPETVDMNFTTRIDSLYALMEEFGIKSAVTVDAEVSSRINVHIGKRFEIGYETKIPWYLVQPDSQHVYYGLNSRLVGTLKGRVATIDSYDIGIMDRHFKQERPSEFVLDENMTLHIRKLAVLNSGTLHGTVDLERAEGHIALDGGGIRYSGPEGNLTCNAHLTADFNSSALDAEGEVKLLGDTLITYLPKKEYTVTDEDIVIIQDIREPGKTATTLDIHIYADKPIHYRIPMVKVDLKPDVTLWKEAEKPMGLLGIVRVTGGEIDTEGKTFEILPSEIYFAGNWPINPYLDLRVGYRFDYMKFTIYVSHTLSDPVFYFSSEPPMSQNDILSYILFGTPADESFQGGKGGSSSVATMILGLGIKNAIGSATGIHFDTFNILQTEEGGYGIEIGKRIGKNLRIIYRNDSLSSFILQYNVSQSVRVTVDTHETGQGVNILYIRDMRSPKWFNRVEPR
ncbi:translocation/assembly module TamB domain-containing protein [Hydrogenimonas sp. SS33]|uniref:translocation/assembly module TamB domain-containing protein n=1 Tax=Hydrogenimonas leucolamina TaxID=2954236 RepID=UPI00336C1D30